VRRNKERQKGAVQGGSGIRKFGFQCKRGLRDLELTGEGQTREPAVVHFLNGD